MTNHDQGAKTPEPLYKSEDFDFAEAWERGHAAEQANALLRGRLAKAPRVCGTELAVLGEDAWSWEPYENDTHEARLVCVRKLGDG